MARKKVPFKDQELIKRRLAEGKSQREAIKGTVVEHHTTAGNIAKREFAHISQLRTEYITLIEQFQAGDIDRAKLWAEMTRATKVISAMVVVKKGSLASQASGELPLADEKTNDFIEVPDWTSREKALAYIDKLKGITQEVQPIQATQVNIFNRLREEEKKFIEGGEK